MKITDSIILSNIYSTMGMLDGETLNDSGDYNFRCISVFNHRLTNDEAENQILFYQQALEEKNAVKLKKYYEYHDKLLEFYLDLYRKTMVYGMMSDEYSGSNVGITFDNLEEYKSHVLLSIREQLFLKIVLPEFYSVIKGNFDLMHLLYTLKSKPEGFEKISSIIKSHGLFILN